jgi:predicted kinase
MTTHLSKPSLIVITGRPGSGKTTLAPALAQAVRCPLVSRDELKEGFIQTIGNAGAPGDDIARRVYETFFDTIELLLTRQITLIAEAAFQHKVWAPKLEPLRAIAQIRIIVCNISTALAHTRRAARAQSDPAHARFHPDRVGPDAEYDPPRLDMPTLTLDTTDGYQPDFERVVAFAMGRSSVERP